MQEFRIVTEVRCPVHRAFAFVRDPENVPRYSPLVAEARRTSNGPIRLGSTAVLAGRFLGRRFVATGQVTEYVANERFTTETVSGPFQLEAALTFVPLGGSTRIDSLFRGESRGFVRIADPLVMRIARAQFERFARTLKGLLDDLPPEPGPRSPPG